ncbi:hypothetical protein BJX68DRAFT_274200 [Aspergillus pseudodeflectus]|uniref:Zn(2)-C6 fungal-type domain-containing protein n=1 Tax=Aspergillus pseudodeflectus TaxID=176178 RepID=A0ABR4KSJ4_9EURO
MMTTPRLRASLACQSCRRRKVKCDAQTTPVASQCTPCRHLGVRCIVDRNSDRRRLTARKQVEILEQRVRGLESLLRHPAQNNSHNESPGVPDEGLPASPSASVAQDIVSGLFPEFQTALPTFEFAFADCLLPFNDQNNDISNSVCQFEPTISPRRSLSSDSDTSVDEGSTTHGVGALGPTSQSHLRRLGSRSKVVSTHLDEFADLGIVVDINSTHLKNRLLDSFFQYQPLWVSVVDEHCFRTHQSAQELSMWYSPFLEIVMLACSARLSTSSAVQLLAEEYSAQAKLLIPQALKNPSAAAMQGFLLLSEYEATQGRERVGWQLCGMACRLLSDLGLHSSLDPCSGQENISVRRARLHLFGACIAFEGVWCLYLGRPSSIPRVIIRNAPLSCTKYQELATPTLSAWLGLCYPMAEACDILNSSVLLDEEAISQLRQLDTRLQRWRQDLPPGFQWVDHNAADLDPTAYGVHMQYCNVQILIQQALLRVQDQELLEHNSGAAQTTQQRIYNSAIDIIRLLLTFRHVHGAEKVPAIMLENTNLALEALIDHYLRHPSPSEHRGRDFQWLRLAIASMAHICSQFPIVDRMLDSWREVVKSTPLLSLFPTMEGNVDGASIQSKHVIEHPGRRGQTGEVKNRSPFEFASCPPQCENNGQGVASSTLPVESMEIHLPRNGSDDLSTTLLCWPSPQATEADPFNPRCTL